MVAVEKGRTCDPRQHFDIGNVWSTVLDIAYRRSKLLIRNLSSTIFAPGSKLLAEEFGISEPSLKSLTVTIYMLGLVAGPVVVAPMSEKYGRLMPYHISNLLFFAFTVGCAKSTSTGAFLACRFLAGCAGSAPLTIGGGTIADVVPTEKRGVAMGIFSLGPTLGPSLGPIIGGFVAQYKGWRWTFWVLLIMVSGIIEKRSPTLSHPCI